MNKRTLNEPAISHKYSVLLPIVNLDTKNNKQSVLRFTHMHEQEGLSVKGQTPAWQ